MYVRSVFISYRRTDNGHARYLFEKLRQWFDEDQLFFDRAAIEPGECFPQVIQRALTEARAVLVVIGPRWLDTLNERTSSAGTDYVRVEVVAALNRLKTSSSDFKVFPILVGGASMPRQELLHQCLQEELMPLLQINALEIHGSIPDTDQQCCRLRKQLGQIAGMPEPRDLPPHLGEWKEAMEQASTTDDVSQANRNLYNHLLEQSQPEEPLIPSARGQDAFDLLHQDIRSDEFAAFVSGNFQLLTSRLQQETESAPQNPDAWRKLGAVLTLSGHLEDAVEAYQRALKLEPGDVDSLLQFGQLSARAGFSDKAEKSLLSAIGQATKTGDRHNLGFAYAGLANLRRIGGGSDEALTLYGKAIVIFEECEELVALADAITGMGLVEGVRGEHHRAEALHRRALSLFEQADSLIGVARAHGNLAVVSKERCDFDQAESQFDNAIQINKRAGAVTGLINNHMNLGNIKRIRGDWSKARSHWQQGQVLAETIGHQSYIAKLADCLGHAELVERRYFEAEEQFRRSVEIHRTLNDVEGLGVGYFSLGTMFLQRARDKHVPSDLELAEEAFQEALLEFRKIERKAGEAGVFGNLGLISRLRHQFNEAIDRYQTALRIDEKIGNKVGIAMAHLNIGELWRLLEYKTRARTHLEVCVRYADDVGAVHIAAKARGLLRDL